MRAGSVLVGLLALLLPLALAWSKDDREIFRIRDEITANESPGMTFYDVLGVTLTASHEDITKAYRRLSKALHPDKVQQRLRQKTEQDKQDGNSNDKTKRQNKNSKSSGALPSNEEVRLAVKKASDRQARLMLIANILKGPGRDRYDHFLRNGFPIWKGTEYYYHRYRPGLPAVIIGLFLVGGGGFHYLALYMSWRRKREFVERYIRFARDTAWGGNFPDIPGIDGPTAATPIGAAEPINPDAGENAGPPQPSNRKQRRIQERDARKDAAKDATKRSKKRSGEKQQGSQSPSGNAKKRVIAENGKVMVVDSVGNVYLEQEDEDGNVEELLLDPDELPRPRIQDTLLMRMPVWLYQNAMTHLLGRKFREAGQALNAPYSSPETLDDDESDEIQHTPISGSSDGFELLDQSIEPDMKSQSTSSQMPSAGKAGKRKGKSR